MVPGAGCPAPCGSLSQQEWVTFLSRWLVRLWNGDTAAWQEHLAGGFCFLELTLPFRITDFNPQLPVFYLGKDWSPSQAQPLGWCNTGFIFLPPALLQAHETNCCFLGRSVYLSEFVMLIKFLPVVFWRLCVSAGEAGTVQHVWEPGTMGQELLALVWGCNHKGQDLRSSATDGERYPVLPSPPSHEALQPPTVFITLWAELGSSPCLFFLLHPSPLGHFPGMCGFPPCEET